MKKIFLLAFCLLLAFSLIACNENTPNTDNDNGNDNTENNDTATDPHSHDFGEWIRYTYDANTPCDARLYYRICASCKDIEWKNGGYENHSLTTTTIAPTCVAQGYDENTCSVCGFTEKVNYTAIAGHKYETTYSYNNSFHWLDCKHCDEITSYATHSIDDSGCCTVCNQPAPTEGVLYELSADRTYATVVGYEGTETDIVISNTYKGVPVTVICEEAFRENNSITSVVIPDSVTSIGGYAFYYCSNLTSVSIGNNVTSISSSAFEYCNSALYTEYEYGKYVRSGDNPYAVLIKLINENLSTYTINENSKHIADNVFSHCANLTTITIPDSVTSIGGGAFDSCYSLTSVSIGNNVTSISNHAFYDCFRLTSITIPGSVTSIGSYAFSHCSKLATITVSDGNTAYKSIDGNLYTKDAKTLVQYAIGKTDTSFTIQDSVTSIGDGAFVFCSSLTSITIPDSVTSIGRSAFAHCYSLTSITIPDSVTSIGSSAFEYCSRLTNVSIGYSVTSIGDMAFEGCSSLTSITIPDSVTSIGYEAFYNCSSLKNVYYTGSEEEWKTISIGSSNSYLTNATIHYNYVPEEE